MYVCSITFLVIRGGYRDLIKRLSQIVTIQKKNCARFALDTQTFYKQKLI